MFTWMSVMLRTGIVKFTVCNVTSASTSFAMLADTCWVAPKSLKTFFWDLINPHGFSKP